MRTCQKIKNSFYQHIFCLERCHSNTTIQRKQMNKYALAKCGMTKIVKQMYTFLDSISFRQQMYGEKVKHVYFRNQTKMKMSYQTSLLFHWWIPQIERPPPTPTNNGYPWSTSHGLWHPVLKLGIYIGIKRKNVTISLRKCHDCSARFV